MMKKATRYSASTPAKDVLQQLLNCSLLVLAMLTASCVNSANNAGPVPAKADLAITNVDIFDSQTKTVLADKTILIDGDTVRAIVDADEVVAADKTIAGNDRLVVPGFIDTHAHLGQIYLRGFRPGEPVGPPPVDDRAELSKQYLAFGTTTLVDMGQAESWLDMSLDWQAHPSPDFPNLYVLGGALVSESDEPAPPHFVEVSPDTIEAKLTDYKARGIERIKLYRKLELEDMKAVIETADALGIRYYAHTDNNVVTIPQAMDLGVRDFEHFFTLVPSTLALREEMGPLMKAQGLNGIHSADEFAAIMVFFFDTINKRPELKATLIAILDEMAARHASLSTTINVLASSAGRSSFYCSFEPDPDRTEPALSYTAEQKEKLSDSFDVMMSFVKLAADKGVTFRIGTDCAHGGQALLSELLLLRAAGFSAEDTLQIATWNGAKSMGLEDQLGEIAVGKKADMILFEKSPLGSAQNLMSEKTIIKGGQVYSP